MLQLKEGITVFLECSKEGKMNMQASQFFEWSVDESKVATLTLNRPEIHNAFNDEMIHDLTALFENKDVINGTRLIVVRGNG